MITVNAVLPPGADMVRAEDLCTGNRFALAYPLGHLVQWVAMAVDTNGHRHVWVHDHLGGTWIFEPDAQVALLA